MRTGAVGLDAASVPTTIEEPITNDHRAQVLLKKKLAIRIVSIIAAIRILAGLFSDKGISEISRSMYISPPGCFDAVMYNVEHAAMKTLKPWERISAAVGYARYGEGDSLEAVFKRADKAMYARKTEMKAHVS